MNKKYFDEKEVIQSVIDFNYTDLQEESEFNIAYGIDKNFLFGCGVSIASILLSNSSGRFAFHIFTDYFSSDDKAKFEALASQYKSRIVVYIINCEKLKSLPSTKNWTYATYFRFIIADYFSGKTDKVLYLDADIACKSSIQELLDLVFKPDEIAAVVAEGDALWWDKRSVSLKTPGLSNGYFNAGFLLINIPQWAAESISEKAIEMLHDQQVVSIISHLDQDVLNMLLVGRVRFIDKKFNTQFSINYELKDTVVNPVNEETVFIHYIGPTKPWHVWGNYPVSQSFIKAKDASPWKENLLLEPANSNQFRYCAKHQFKQGIFLLGIKSYVQYYFSKLKNK